MSSSMVFLHGWGQSRRIWFGQMQPFADAHFLNLPGHGGAPIASDWTTTLAKQLPAQSSILIGWSLGAIFALELAVKHPDKVAGLVLVSATPTFCNRPDWSHGCSQKIFDTFKKGIRNNAPKTMSRFFSLMLQGDSTNRCEYNQIAKQSVEKTHLPTVETLQTGLDYLANTDLRDSLQAIHQPTLVLHGEHDAIIPASAGMELARAMPNSDYRLFDACGHAPFLTQRRKFNTILESWCQTI